jgi:hypothetical protein
MDRRCRALRLAALLAWPRDRLRDQAHGQRELMIRASEGNPVVFGHEIAGS